MLLNILKLSEAVTQFEATVFKMVSCFEAFDRKNIVRSASQILDITFDTILIQVWDFFKIFFFILIYSINANREILWTGRYI